MTTPERFRRRQRIEEGIMIVLAAAMVVQTAYFHGQTDSQQKCLQKTVHELTTTLDARANLSDRDSKNTSEMILAVSTAKTPQDFQRILYKYKATYQAIQQDRKEHPVPPYPPGSCN